MTEADMLALAERILRFFGFERDRIILCHGQYPMSDRPQSERCESVQQAKARVRRIYAGKWGWWFQITKNGKEVWSSDHELAALRARATKDREAGR